MSFLLFRKASWPVSINIFGLIGVIISCIFATVISTLLITCLGLFAFYMEDANPLYWIYSKFILVLGTIFPIEYFPKVLQPIINLSPIYAVSYGPAKLFVDFSLGVPAGKSIGLVGVSGSGKTTLTKLLLRFADVKAGAIYIDGQDNCYGKQEFKIE